VVSGPANCFRGDQEEFPAAIRQMLRRDHSTSCTGNSLATSACMYIVRFTKYLTLPVF